MLDRNPFFEKNKDQLQAVPTWRELKGSVFMRSNIFLPAATIFFALGFTDQSLAEKIYKWTDEWGRTHYSQQNPPNQTATVIDPDETISVMEGLTPDMEKRLKDLEKREKKEQAAREREAKRVRLEQEKKDKDAALVAECKKNLRSYCDSADHIRRVENHQADGKRSFSGRRER